MRREPAAVTEREIQRRLWFIYRSSYRLLVPNYTPRGWWECDMFGVTKAGYFTEFEIKLTLADFRSDRSKCCRDRTGLKFKHEQLETRATAGPSAFWYVAPAGVIPLNEIPKWAGLQEFNGRSFKRVKPAPRLHWEKVHQSIVHHALTCCYWRFWRERTGLD